MRGRLPFGPARRDPPRRFEPIHLGHLHVHQDHVVGLPPDRLHRLDAVRRQVGAVAHLLQQPHGELLVHDVVFGEQDAQRMARGERGVDLRLGGGLRGLRRSVVDEQRHERVEQLALVQGLGERRGEDAVALLASAERAEEHQRQRMPGGADARRELAAVHARHVHVDDGQVEGIAREHRDRARRVLAVSDTHAPLGHLQREDAPIGRVVVDDEGALSLQRRLHADEFAPRSRWQARRWAHAS